MSEPKREESREPGWGEQVLNTVDLADAATFVVEAGQTVVGAAGSLLSAVSELVDI